MMATMKFRLLHLYMTLALLVAPVIAWAAKEDEETALLEARLEGFPVPVRLAQQGAGVLPWMMVCVLSLIVITSLFKNAKRTHLD
jgi:hypothetical protein